VVDVSRPGGAAATTPPLPYGIDSHRLLAPLRRKEPELTSRDVPVDSDGPEISTTSSAANRRTELLTIQGLCAAGTTVILAGLYLLFVVHYSVNTLFADDWRVVPLLHAALHGHLTFANLWAQHNENRILLPNLVFVAVGVLSRDDTRTGMIVNAAILIVSFVLLLDLYRSYAGRTLHPLWVLSLGLVWFSLADFANALWQFQLAWYLVLFLLMSMMWFLLAVRRTTVTFALACIGAAAASYSSLQGLILWPIGLLCLLWTLPEKRHARRRWASVEIIAWLSLGVTTTTIYFLDYVWGNAGQPITALHHPIEVGKFFLVAVGNVIPIASPQDLLGAEAIGLFLSLTAIVVVALSVRERRLDRRSPLVVALIAFAFLFDLSIALGRLSFGVPYALQARYEMPNLVLLVAVVAYVLAHIPTGRPSEQRKRPATAVEHKPIRFLLGLLGVVVVTGFVLVQVPTATQYGLTNATQFDRRLTNGARYLANLNQVPVADRPCYDADFFGSYSSFAYLQQSVLLEVQQDRLSLFAPGPNRIYRADGPPPLTAQCPKAPTTQVIIPSSNAILSRTTILDATAPNATRVEFVLFGGGRYYGLSIGTAARTPYGWIYRWDTTSVPNGSYLLLSIGFNSVKRGVSSQTKITIQNERLGLK